MGRRHPNAICAECGQAYKASCHIRPFNALGDHEFRDLVGALDPTPTKPRSIYLIGSMKSPRITATAAQLRDAGFDVFDDWYSPGPDTDDHWQRYEKQRGRTFREALAGHHAQHAFALDKKHLERCDIAVLVAPAGKSAHLELGWVLGQGKPGYILMDGEPDRYDLMYLFATGIFMSVDEMIADFKDAKPPRSSFAR